MADRKFAINTEPHKALIGNDTLWFQPEVVGAAFAQAYSGLKSAQKRVSAAGEDVGAEELIVVNDAMREFLSGLMLPESAQLFETMELPDRILVELLQWTAELYGGGPGNGRGGPSSTS